MFLLGVVFGKSRRDSVLKDFRFRDVKLIIGVEILVEGGIRDWYYVRRDV